MKKTIIPLYSTNASLWDGKNQFIGKLEIFETHIIFKFQDFNKSHINLVIPIAMIDKVEEFLVFDLARNGLRIKNKNGKYDLFIIEDAKKFKFLVLNKIENLVNEYTD